MKLAATLSLYANRKLHYRRMYQGLPISVENREGSIRRGVDPKWGPWETRMKFPYGYVRGTKGKDGDEVDCFVGPDDSAENAFVVTIMKPPDFKKEDEDKVMLGFPTAEAAKRAFLNHYSDPKFFGSMKTVSMSELREQLLQQKQIAANLGEPQVYDGGYAHIDPKPTFHPPSVKKPQRVPTDDPMETDNKFLDVTKRNSKETKRRRDAITRQHTNENMRPLNSTQVSGFPAVTIGGFG